MDLSSVFAFILILYFFRYIFSIFGTVLGWIISIIPSILLYIVTDSIFGFGISSLTFTEIISAIAIANLLGIQS